MKQKITALLLALTSIFVAEYSTAQPVPKKVVVEHYTNTYCSVCASRNPGFYGNLWSFPEVLHIAYHPSAPYAACPLSQHNVAENNARTNYYGIFGGTPRLVIQGSVLPASADYSSPTIFTSVMGETTPFSMYVTLTGVGTDSIKATVVIKKEDTSPLLSLMLYGALTEDTLFFTAANGEPRSYDVFRKSLWGTTSLNVTAPAAIGDSVVVEQTVSIHSDWVPGRMSATVMLQDASKNMLQAARSAKLSGTAGTVNMSRKGLPELFPNPARDFFTIGKSDSYPIQLQLYSVAGKMLISDLVQTSGERIDVSALPEGAYIVKLTGGGVSAVHRFIKM